MGILAVVVVQVIFFSLRFSGAVRFGVGLTRVLRRRLCGRDLLGSGDRSPVPASGRRRETEGDPGQERQWSDGEHGRATGEMGEVALLGVCVIDSAIRCYYSLLSCVASPSLLLQGFLAWTAALLLPASRKEGKGRWPCRSLSPSPGVCARVVCQHLCCGIRICCCCMALRARICHRRPRCYME